MSDLVLSGAIPGLLRRGAPVVLVGGPWAGQRGVWLPENLGPSLVAFPVEPAMGSGWCNAGVREVAHVALDLSEAEGVDRARSWLASRFEARLRSPLRDRPLSSGGVTWHYEYPALWVLGTWNTNFRVSFAGDGANYVDVQTVPALAHIDLTSPTADVEALIAVVRHLAGVSDGR